jgi:hypothetical protein
MQRSEAAARNNEVDQHATQSRSIKHEKRAMEHLHDGATGEADQIATPPICLFPVS